MFSVEFDHTLVADAAFYRDIHIYRAVWRFPQQPPEPCHVQFFVKGREVPNFGLVEIHVVGVFNEVIPDILHFLLLLLIGGDRTTS